MPVAVVDVLEVVEVDEEHRRPPGLRRRSEYLADPFREQRPIGQPGELVVGGLVVERLLQRGQLAQRLLHQPVLEQHRRLARVRLEQPRILTRERRVDVAHRDDGDDAGRSSQPGE
jgi:hypothetical protein